MKRNTGFTLIEVMVVVAIVAILATIAIPNYRDYLIRGKISEGLAVLSTMSTQLEQHFQDNRGYNSACQPGVGVAPLPPPTANFTFACPIHDATTYVVQASGRGAMANFVYEIAPGGVHVTRSLGAGWSNAGLPNNCWVKNRSGAC